jgi:hypothetical protein
MPAGTTAILAGAAALAGTGMSLAQMQEAKRQKKDALMAASAAANAFKNIKEGNAYAGVQVPTMGYELAQQGIDRAAMSALSAAQGAGVEGVIGAAPGIVGGTASASLEQQAGLQEAEYNRNLAQAQAEQGIQARKAAREEDLYNAQLMGSQGAAQQAEINRQKAIASAVESGTQALSSFGELIPLYFGKDKNKATSTNTGGSFLQTLNAIPVNQIDFTGSPIAQAGKYYDSKGNEISLSQYYKILNSQRTGLSAGNLPGLNYPEK